MHGLGLRLIVTPVFYSRHQHKRVATTLALARRLRARGGFWTEHMFCRELCDMASLVLPNTEDEITMLEKGLSVPRMKMRELVNGVEERFGQASPDPFVQAHGIRDFVLYVGHIGPGRKNVLTMLKACERLGHPTVLIGPVSGNDYAEQCLSIVSRCPFMKVIPGLPPDSPMLESAYAACDTLVLPGHYETPGLAALEAGLAGAKVCITRYGGTREYFAEHASYLEPSSEDSIFNAIKESLGKTKSAALRERIRASYLWRHAGEALLTAYRDVSTTAA
jgi:glycosyltransferase involved in cell wall biosynthesis